MAHERARSLARPPARTCRVVHLPLSLAADSNIDLTGSFHKNTTPFNTANSFITAITQTPAFHRVSYYTICDPVTGVVRLPSTCHFS
jgi:hypothetical protein